MIYVSHRINSRDDLKNTPSEYGVEIDVRDYGDQLILSHDPYILGESFEEYLANYHHKFIILNIKSERIEPQIIKLLEKYKISDYFFLDSSFPMIYSLSKAGERNIALRYSEWESLESVLLMVNKVNWVWIDSFDNFSLSPAHYNILKEKGFKICIVSPELQQQPEKIEVYGKYMLENHIIPDMICTKKYNISRWQKMFN